MAVHHAFVKAELDGIVDTLYENPERKFTFPQVKYLQMWYTRQNQAQKDKLKKIIKNG